MLAVAELHPRINAPVLKALAPARQPGEALSSWLARSAAANLLTLGELEAELGCRLGGVDWGGGDARTAATLLGADQVQAAIDCWERAAERTPPADAPESWAVCAECLREDLTRGEAPYIRARWLHPLVTACPNHAVPLAPYYAGAAVVPDDFLGRPAPLRLTSAGRTSRVAAATSYEVDVARTAFEAAPDVRRGLTQVAGDVADALAVRSEHTGCMLLHLLPSRPRGERAMTSLAVHRLPQALLWTMDATERLLFARGALEVLAEPALAQTAADKPPEWLSAAFQCTRPRREGRALQGVTQDGLLLPALYLPRTPGQEFHERTARWPRAFRQRWAYARTVAAFAGLN